MNKLKKIGLSALCGSLAAATGANAGELSVSGSATVSYTSVDGDVTGNPLGMNSGMTFVGSGELDSGATYKYTLTQADQTAYSAGSIVLTTAFGTFGLGHGHGGHGIDAYDDAMPTAWEETWGTGVGTGVHLVNGIGSSTNVQYKTPVVPVLGMTLAVAYAGKVDGTQINDKGNSAAGSDDTGHGYDAVVTLNPNWGGWNSGLNIFAGGHVTRGTNPNPTVVDDSHNDDAAEGVLGATFALGPVTIGAQKTAEYVKGAKRTGTDPDYYTGKHYGVSFQVNDDLSLSWGNMVSKKYFVDPGNNEAVEIDAESWQIAYSMGGIAFKFAETSVDNATYTSGTSADKDGTTLAVTFAF